MNVKKNLFTLLFALLVICLVLVTIFVLPKNNKEESVGSSLVSTSSDAILKIPVSELISVCDTVVTGNVIKADVLEDGVLYTLQIETVFKGRNYTSMGYAFVNGKQKLNIFDKYLFFGATHEEKYHYFEPFENAPWVYKISDNTVIELAQDIDNIKIKDLIGVTLEEIKDICNQK